jgi:hypothetical protein
MPAALVLVLGCAAHSTDSTELEAEAPASPVVEAERAPEASPELVEDGPDCLPAGFTPQPPTAPSRVAPPATGACWSLPKATARELRAEIDERWMKSEGMTLNIDFGCDRLGKNADIEVITWQSGSGHGGTLDLARLTRVEGEAAWDLVLLRHSGGYYGGADVRGAGVWRGRVPDAQVDAALERARGVLAAEVEEVRPPGTHGFSSSSGDFHAFLRLQTAAGHGREAAFTGYPSSSKNQRWVLPALASAAFYELIDDAALTLAEPDADSRALFMERFAEAEARGYYGGFAGWWVHERLVEMAGLQASADLIPRLAERLCLANDGSTKQRTRAAALQAIVSLNGGDPGTVGEEEDGYVTVSDEEVATWIAACELECPAPAQAEDDE